MGTYTNFKLFSQTPLMFGGGFENLVIRANDIANSGVFGGFDANGNPIAKLPYMLVNRQIGNDAQPYILAQFRGTANGTIVNTPSSITLINNASPAVSSFQTLLNINVADIGGIDPVGTTPPTTSKGVYGGFIVNATGGAPTATGDYTLAGYSILLPYDFPVGYSITINSGDYVWLRKPLSTTAP